MTFIPRAKRTEHRTLEKRVFRIETILWVLFLMEGVPKAVDLIPVVSALISGG